MNEMTDFRLLDEELQKKIIEVNMKAVKAGLSEPFNGRGSTGPQGIQGITEPKCFTGPKGIVGDIGPQGPKGPIGMFNCQKCGSKKSHWNPETDVNSCLGCGWEYPKAQIEMVVSPVVQQIIGGNRGTAGIGKYNNSDRR